MLIKYINIIPEYNDTVKTLIDADSCQPAYDSMSNPDAATMFCSSDVIMHLPPDYKNTCSLQI